MTDTTWWHHCALPELGSTFDKLFRRFVFDCPASVRLGKGKLKRYEPVSRRRASFKERGIEGPLLNTLRAQMKRTLPNKCCYIKIHTNSDMQKTIDATRMFGMKDPNFNLIVFRERNDMPDVEAIYYYIRNAFAHGSIEVLSTQQGNVYLLESAKNEKVNAQIRLSEAAMNELVRIMDMTPNGLKALQRKR